MIGCSINVHYYNTLQYKKCCQRVFFRLFMTARGCVTLSAIYTSSYSTIVSKVFFDIYV